LGPFIFAGGNRKYSWSIIMWFCSALFGKAITITNKILIATICKYCIDAANGLILRIMFTLTTMQLYTITLFFNYSSWLRGTETNSSCSPASLTLSPAVRLSNSVGLSAISDSSPPSFKGVRM